MMQRIYPYIIACACFFLFVFAASKTSNSGTIGPLLTTQKTFIAGKSIQLQFASSTLLANADLFLIHSYGKTLLQGKNLKGKLTFIVPPIYSAKTGLVSWYLIQNKKNVQSGNFEILPNDNTPTQLENYLGPNTILTGPEYYTMMVAIPTDSYDNPKKNNTAVYIKDQFLDNISVTAEKTASFIAWKNIYSRTKSGKMLVSTECEKTTSKEFETELNPGIPTNFKIEYSRNHQFADGNQITKLQTSAITDRFGNLVGDGTLVVFQVVTKNNMFLKTFASTINGIAIAQLLHPDHAETYSVKAYIAGMAESNTLAINYKPLLNDFSYEFSEKNRKITVGPIQSFMKQIVPDGIKVELKIFHQGKLLETKIVETNKGYAHFNLLAAFYKKTTYQFEITTLGITKKTETKHYETN